MKNIRINNSQSRSYCNNCQLHRRFIDAINIWNPSDSLPTPLSDFSPARLVAYTPGYWRLSKSYHTIFILYCITALSSILLLVLILIYHYFLYIFSYIISLVLYINKIYLYKTCIFDYVFFPLRA